jgi:threonine efflux protein
MHSSVIISAMPRIVGAEERSSNRPAQLSFIHCIHWEPAVLTAFVTVMILHWVVLVTPGANVLLISQLAASGDKRGAMYASLGVCTVTFVWATLAILGVNALFAAVPQLRIAVQIAGGAYLVYVAIRLWQSGQSAAGRTTQSLEPWPAFRMGFLTNITNPKSALFFGSVFGTALPHDSGAMVWTVAVVLVVINALVWHFLLALAFSHPRVQAGYARPRQWLNRIAATIVGAMGSRLLIASLDEVRSR